MSTSAPRSITRAPCIILSVPVSFYPLTRYAPLSCYSTLTNMSTALSLLHPSPCHTRHHAIHPQNGTPPLPGTPLTTKPSIGTTRTEMGISIPSSSRSACYTPLASQSTPLRMLCTHSVVSLFSAAVSPQTSLLHIFRYVLPTREHAG